MQKLAASIALSTLLLAAGALAAPQANASDAAAQANASNAGRAKGERKNFEACDTNKDGFLTKDEFTACFPRGAKKFDEIDANKDGKISKDDLKTYRESKKEERAAKFDNCDQDKDGALNQTEFASCYPRLAKRFDRFDADKNGKVTKEEMKTRFSSQFAKRAAGKE